MGRRPESDSKQWVTAQVLVLHMGHNVGSGTLLWATAGDLVPVVGVCISVKYPC
jgi:hypothetical protein